MNSIHSISKPVSQLPSTVNLHFIRACNFSCRFCFAGFEECGRGRLSTAELAELIERIAAEPLPAGSGLSQRKINFVGGEPTLARDLPHLVRVAKAAGLQTSIVTNGYRLVHEGLDAYAGSLDMLGLSIDSTNSKINRRIGRSFQGKVIRAGQWLKLAAEARRAGITLKVNTVVSRDNLFDPTMASLVGAIQPRRWKVFQVMPVQEQNGAVWDEVCIMHSQYIAYVNRQRRALGGRVELIAEDNDLMRGSYAMVSPDGRFFDSSSGRHRYSTPILHAGVADAFEEVEFCPEKFQARSGDYQLHTSSVTAVA